MPAQQKQGAKCSQCSYARRHHGVLKCFMNPPQVVAFQEAVHTRGRNGEPKIEHLIRVETHHPTIAANGWCGYYVPRETEDIPTAYLDYPDHPHSDHNLPVRESSTGTHPPIRHEPEKV